MSVQGPSYVSACRCAPSELCILRNSGVDTLQLLLSVTACRARWRAFMLPVSGQTIVQTRRKRWLAVLSRTPALPHLHQSVPTSCWFPKPWIVLTHWGRVTQICVFYITTVQDGWRKSAFLTRAWFPCTIHLIMQYIEPISEWSCWGMFIETWPHSELTFRHRASSV